MHVCIEALYQVPHSLRDHPTPHATTSHNGYLTPLLQDPRKSLPDTSQETGKSNCTSHREGKQPHLSRDLLAHSRHTNLDQLNSANTHCCHVNRHSTSLCVYVNILCQHHPAPSSCPHCTHLGPVSSRGTVTATFHYHQLDNNILHSKTNPTHFSSLKLLLSASWMLT